MIPVLNCSLLDLDLPELFVNFEGDRGDLAGDIGGPPCEVRRNGPGRALLKPRPLRLCVPRSEPVTPVPSPCLVTSFIGALFGELISVFRLGECRGESGTDPVPRDFCLSLFSLVESTFSVGETLESKVLLAS